MTDHEALVAEVGECCGGDTAKCPALSLLQSTFPLILETAVNGAKAGAKTTNAMQSLEKEVKEHRAALPHCPCTNLSDLKTEISDLKAEMQKATTAVTSLTERKSLLGYLFQPGSGPAVLKVLIPAIIGASGFFWLQECSTVVQQFARPQAIEVSSDQPPPGEGTVP